MAKVRNVTGLRFLARDAASIRRILAALHGLEVPIEFDTSASRRFRFGPMDFAVLFNRDVFHNPAGFTALAERRVVLAVVAFFSRATGTYRANRLVVLEPTGRGRVHIQVLGTDGKEYYRGEGAVTERKLAATIRVTLPGIPVGVRVSGELTASGDIRLRPSGLAVRLTSRSPSAERPASS